MKVTAVSYYDSRTLLSPPNEIKQTVFVCCVSFANVIQKRGVQGNLSPVDSVLLVIVRWQKDDAVDSSIVASLEVLDTDRCWLVPGSCCCFLMDCECYLVQRCQHISVLDDSKLQRSQGSECFLVYRKTIFVWGNKLIVSGAVTKTVIACR